MHLSSPPLFSCMIACRFSGDKRFYPVTENGFQKAKPMTRRSGFRMQRGSTTSSGWRILTLCLISLRQVRARRLASRRVIYTNSWSVCQRFSSRPCCYKGLGRRQAACSVPSWVSILNKAVNRMTFMILDRMRQKRDIIRHRPHKDTISVSLG